MNLNDIEAIIPGETKTRMEYLERLLNRLEASGIACEPISQNDLERLSVTVKTQDGNYTITSDFAEHDECLKILKRHIGIYSKPITRYSACEPQGEPK